MKYIESNIIFWYKINMHKLTIYTNPDTETHKTLQSEYKFNDEIFQILERSNKRVEVKYDATSIFLIMHIPEYDTKAKAIRQVELNLLYDCTNENAMILCYNTSYFFDKYKSNIQNIIFTSFETLLEKIYRIIFEDVSLIIDHLLEDTSSIKDEYYTKSDPAMLVRHLTNNLINISTLKLIVSSQNKLINILQINFKLDEKGSLEYKKNNINHELEFASEFCDTLLQSLDTRYEVKESENMWRLESIMFVIFVTELVLTFAKYAFEGNIKSYIIIIIGIISLILTYMYVRSKK